jgi:hypothetical protein
MPFRIFIMALTFDIRESTMSVISYFRKKFRTAVEQAGKFLKPSPERGLLKAVLILEKAGFIVTRACELQSNELWAGNEYLIAHNSVVHDYLLSGVYDLRITPGRKLHNRGVY